MEAVCRRADVSSVLAVLNDDGANMVYVDEVRWQ